MKMRSHCPVNFGLEHFGVKWALLIIRDLMFKGKRHYNQFLEGGENISTSVLRDKLRLLQEGGIITKGQDHVKKSRIRYSLEKKGIALLPMMIEMISWSGEFDKETEADLNFLSQAKGNKEKLLTELRNKINFEHLL